jgi:hypothetical protein
VVGSGAGGGDIAGELAGAGLDVVVLEAGGHAEEADFPADELSALRELYWRGGLNLTEDGNVAILAGATLGGGSTINWQNCVRPPELVRSRWATEHGLAGLEGADFDAHLDAVLDRISATSDCTDLNGVNQVLADAAEGLAWSWRRAVRNTDPASYSPETAGHVGFGDRTGSKQGTLRTYLTDAAVAGARIVCRAHMNRLLLDHGHTAGVVAELRLPTGARELTVRADTVVIAAGALETPAILLRSGVGGPAVGQHLRLHPVPMITGLYDHDLKALWGPPQATIVDEHRAAVSDHGCLVETAHLHRISCREAAGVRRVRLHDTRHAMATLMLAAGIRVEGEQAARPRPDQRDLRYVHPPRRRTAPRGGHLRAAPGRGRRTLMLAGWPDVGPAREPPPTTFSQVRGGFSRETGTGIEPVMGDLQAQFRRLRASLDVPLDARRTGRDLR